MQGEILSRLERGFFKSNTAVDYFLIFSIKSYLSFIKQDKLLKLLDLFYSSMLVQINHHATKTYVETQ